MAIFVDDANIKVRKFGNRVWCHMITDSDSENELHEFAKKIGLKREWYHKNHYDVVQTKKELALRNGAIEITTRELAKITLSKKRKAYKRKQDGNRNNRLRNTRLE